MGQLGNYWTTPTSRSSSKLLPLLRGVTIRDRVSFRQVIATLTVRTRCHWFAVSNGRRPCSFTFAPCLISAIVIASSEGRKRQCSRTGTQRAVLESFLHPPRHNDSNSCYRNLAGLGRVADYDCIRGSWPETDLVIRSRPTAGVFKSRQRKGGCLVDACCGHRLRSRRLLCNPHTR
jgi:hypothetical protein